jgi:predicted AAA+ superfamily ATPase
VPKSSLIKRYLHDGIDGDALAHGKMAFISGPRQCGKSTMGRSLLLSPKNEFNWDQSRFRLAWTKDPEVALEHREPGAVLLDEIHKDRKWKQRIKGFYDVHGEEVPIVVTGSARLDFYRKSGDSLLGRYIPYRLHPFSVGETVAPPEPENWFERSTNTVFPLQDILRLSGFPEPLLRGSEGHAKRWSRLRLERLLTEDVRDFRNISDLHALRNLVELLPERVGSPFSVNSLREDVGVAYATVRDWMLLLESLYVCFFVRPYCGNLKRALRAEPKVYLFDHLPIESPAAKIENLAACHLLKMCHYWTDLALGDFSLHYFRNKEREEIDFVVVKDKKVWMLVECKSGDTRPSKTLTKYQALFRPRYSIQLVSKPAYEKYFPAHSTWVMDYEHFFAKLV